MKYYSDATKCKKCGTKCCKLRISAPANIYPIKLTENNQSTQIFSAMLLSYCGIVLLNKPKELLNKATRIELNLCI